MDGSHAWVLNFDADMELAAPRSYTPKRALLDRFGLYVPKTKVLIGEGAVVISELGGVRCEGVGRAWCMTPRARKMLVCAGARPVEAPPLSVLQAVNHRAFSASLGQTLEGARFVRTLDELIETLGQAPPETRFLAKRAFGFSGRGQKRIALRSAGESGADRAWIIASLRAGEGLQVEPLCARLRDFGLHGYVCPSGEVVLGEPTLQVCDAFGAWRESVRAKPADLSAADRERLFEEAAVSAKALWASGYFGPFGVDAFSWRDGRGNPHFNPRCEINARYSMGWAVGMGARRPDLDER